MPKPILCLTVAISTILYSCSKKAIPEPSDKVLSAQTLAAAKTAWQTCQLFLLYHLAT